MSYYRFTASMTDPDQEVNDTDSLTISIQKDSDSSKGIVLDKAFVRSENGNYYVMKDDNGFLKKQYVLSLGALCGSGWDEASILSGFYIFRILFYINILTNLADCAILWAR